MRPARPSLSLLVPPFLAFVVSEGALGVVAALSGFNPMLPANWARFDSGHYLGIAANGYHVYPCVPGPWSWPSGLCGNAGWLPLYPYAVRLLSKAGLELVVAARLFSAACHLGMLAVVWIRFCRGQRKSVAWLCIATAAFFPGGVYYGAIFPLSAFLLCELWALDAFVRGKTWQAMAAAFAASMFYSTGFVLCGALVAFAAWELFRGERRWLWPALFTAFAAGAGYLAVLFWHQLAVGSWRASLDIYSHYGHGLRNPFRSLWTYMRPLFYLRGRTPAGVALGLQAAWTTAFLFALVPGAVRADARPLDRLLLSYGAAFWAFPLFYGNPATFGIQRAAALLLPVVPLLQRTRVAVACAFLASAVVVALFVAKQFFAFTII